MPTYLKLLNWLFNLNTKIWLGEVSFGFGNLRAIGSTRVWWYFLVHIFKIKKFELISSNVSRDIAKSLKISFGFSFVSFRAFWSKLQFRFQIYTFQTKQTALDYLYTFLSFSVHNFCARTDGRTGRHFLKKFYFCLVIKNIYTCL